jgi:hypothetical protein
MIDYPPNMEREWSEEDEATYRRALWLKRAVVFLCGTVALLSVAVATIVTVSIRLDQLDNTAAIEASTVAAENARKTVERIEDCTTPGQKCFEDGQRRAGVLVQNLSDVIILASACASKPYEQTPAQIEVCVRQKLAAQIAAQKQR